MPSDVLQVSGDRITDIPSFLAGFSPAGGEAIGQKMVHPQGWWFSLRPCDFWLNRELAAPGALPEYPDGAVAIRSDGNFWTEAVLPWTLLEVPLPELAAALWPRVLEKPELAEWGPDVQARLEDRSPF